MGWSSSLVDRLLVPVLELGTPRGVAEVRLTTLLHCGNRLVNKETKSHRQPSPFHSNERRKTQEKCRQWWEKLRGILRGSVEDDEHLVVIIGQLNVDRGSVLRHQSARS